jgi:hypothetical protein
VAVTILAVVFLALITLVAFAGIRFFGKGEREAAIRDGQKCSLCLRTFEKSALIERQVGDYRLLRFCRECVQGLHAELTNPLSRTGSGSPPLSP